MNPEIRFQVISFPTSAQTTFDSLRRKIEHLLTDHCLFNTSSIKAVNLADNRTSSTSIPNILQEVLVCYEVTGHFSGLELAFQCFSYVWLETCRSVFNEESPWLVVIDRCAFAPSTRNVHSLHNQLIQLGTLASPVNFVVHKRFSAHVQFLHDLRNMKIKYKDTNGEKYLVLSYQSIKHILTNGKDVLIIFYNPPVTLDLEETKHVGIFQFKNDILGRSNGILLKFFQSSEKDELLTRLHFRCFQLPVVYALLNYSFDPKPYWKYANNPLWFDFSCGYLIEALYRQKYSLHIQGVEEFISTASRLHYESPETLKKTLSDLVLIAEQGYPLNLTTAMLIRFKSLQRRTAVETLTLLVPENTTFVRRAVLTPTRVLLYPEELVAQKRIFRTFKTDFALRISFRDDELVMLNKRGQIEESLAYATIFKPMLNGLEIAGRKYEFLAWSNSEIKQHSVWMYAKDDKKKTSAIIQRWMGTFPGTSNAAENMTLKGLFLSETFSTFGIPMTSGIIVVEKDIKENLNSETGKPYCFTDGIGRISEEAVKQVCSFLKITNQPSAFHIRHGGTRGTLVLDPTLKEERLVFRKSMLKFLSRRCVLDIVKYSTPMKVFLNRSLIQILDSLNVGTKVLLGLQEEAFENLTNILLDSEKAAKYLQLVSNCGDLDFVEAHKCGIDLSSEPFFRAMLLARHYYDLNAIHQETRFPIDPSDGRTMLGVLDETATLQYGQVFVQYTKDFNQLSNETVILVGSVLVTKYPCYHPGDVRMFQCVDVPGLHHIVDCIVFPQLGHRPHRHEMSGSDLDGDEYSVIWKEDLFFGCNAEPEHLPSPKDIPFARPVRIEHPLKFLVEFIRNDRTRFIANSHLATSEEHGIDAAISKELARHHRIAIDFSKTGQNVNLDDVLEPTKYPDFMEKFHRETYVSKRILGKMFRISRDFLSASPKIRDPYSNLKVDKDLVYPGWEKYREEAAAAMLSYSYLLNNLLEIFGLKHESEVLAGVYTAFHPRFKRSDDNFEAGHVFSMCIHALWKKCREKISMDMDYSIGFTRDVLMRVSAYYIITYSQTNPTILSFPWIFTDCLAKIKQINLELRNQSLSANISPIVTELNLEIEKTEFPPTGIFVVSDYGKNQVFSRNDYKTLSVATNALFNWCREIRVIYSPNARPPRKGFMKDSYLAELIMDFASRETTDDGAVPFILKFLRYCMMIRFLSISERSKIHPLPIPQFNYLSRKAMQAYRNLTLTGSISALKMGEVSTAMEEVEMEPIRMNIPCGNNPEFLCQFLLLHSGVRDISIRHESKYQYVISALGNVSCVRELEEFLRKGFESLQNALALK